MIVLVLAADTCVFDVRYKIIAECSTTSILTVSCCVTQPTIQTTEIWVSLKLNWSLLSAQVWGLCTARVVKAGFPGSNPKLLTTLANEINFEALRCGTEVWGVCSQLLMVFTFKARYAGVLLLLFASWLRRPWLKSIFFNCHLWNLTKTFTFFNQAAGLSPSCHCTFLVTCLLDSLHHLEVQIWLFVKERDNPGLVPGNLCDKLRMNGLGIKFK